MYLFKQKRNLLTITAVACSALLSPNAHALLLDFNSQPADKFISNEFANLSGSNGVTFSATGGAYALPVLFDSHNTDQSDDDLFGPPNTAWLGGNLAAGGLYQAFGDVGNVMIIQENSTEDPNKPGFVIPNTADDEANGGTITMNFTSPIFSFRLDWIDLDEGDGYFFNLVGKDSQGNNTSQQIAFNDFIDSNHGYYDDSVYWGDPNVKNSGDHFANRLPIISAEKVSDVYNTDIVEFDEITIVLEGSGGFANVEINPVPESASYALILSIVAIGFSMTRRRRS